MRNDEKNQLMVLVIRIIIVQNANVISTYVNIVQLSINKVNKSVEFIKLKNFCKPVSNTIRIISIGKSLSMNDLNRKY